MKSKLNFIEKRELHFEVKDKQKFVNKVPKNALVELSNSCNHECVFCYNPEMKRKTSSLNIEKFVGFVKQSAKEGLEEIGLYATGEPFMTKNLDSFIRIAKENGIRRVYITSNGALASIDKVIKCIDAGLDSIKFSINAGTRESYKIIHGFDDFEKVISNLKKIYEFKTNNKIKLQLLCSFVITDLTCDETTAFEQNYNYLFDEKIVFFKAGNQGGRTYEKNKSITRKVKQNNLRKFEYKPCEMLWNRLHLNNEGNLTACCVDYENDLVYTKLNSEKKILEHFNSKKIIELREKHLNNDLDGTICKNCIYNTTVRFNKLMGGETENRDTKNSKTIKNLQNRLKYIKNTN